MTDQQATMIWEALDKIADQLEPLANLRPRRRAEDAGGKRMSRPVHDELDKVRAVLRECVDALTNNPQAWGSLTMGLGRIGMAQALLDGELLPDEPIDATIHCPGCACNPDGPAAP
jgi:hypothetical protein